MDSSRWYLKNGARVTTIGFGEEYPAASNDTAAGRTQNRRAEVKIIE